MTNNTPTIDTSIVPTPTTSCSQQRLLDDIRNPDCATDEFSAAMVELATALRKADRADRRERRLSA